MSENPDSGFKVVDRRPFGVDGTRREDVAAKPQEEKSTPKAQSKKASAAPSSPSLEMESPEYAEQEPSGFETLLDSLSSTAMFLLGLLPGPGGEPIAPDLVNARRAIDLIESLQQRGRPTPAENRLLDDVLYQLRLGFVEVQKRGAPKRK